jgi:outer membrane protein OmpA-like peptidoglycan-associated protein
MRSFFLVLFLFCFFTVNVQAQDEAIPILLKNPSFEGTPVEGGKNMRFTLDGWNDCGAVGQTPPDIHPVPGGGQFGVTTKSADGQSYLGLVVRSDETWEIISQRLESPLLEGSCYEFTISLCRSEKYLSASAVDASQTLEYTTPAKLRIWGGAGSCNKAELLAESALITSYRWLEYNFRFEPKSSHNYIVLEAYFNTPTPFFYNGNVLLDKASAIIPVPCKVVEPEVAELPAVEEPVKKPKILQDLDRGKLREGQTIRIDQLYFAADSSAISANSSEVLAEIYDFLASNPEVVVEIGGHTNGIPSHEYCDRLSAERAKAVVEYLTEKGIPRKRLEYKGYGKRNPVDTNKTAAGRKKNQRVEIKILSVNG